MEFSVRVPATSANLGPGFDTMGLALRIEGKFYFKTADSFKVSGCPEAYQGEDNLVIETYKDVFTSLNKEIIPVHLNIDSNIPLGRGLGSSSSCVIAGLLAANKVLGEPLSKGELLFRACQIEGHPDNVVPAFLGGLKSAYIQDDHVLTIDYPIHESLNFVAITPNFTVSTKEARKALPEKVKLHEAANNSGKLLMLIKAMELGDALFFGAMRNEFLHEPYRKKLIPNFNEIENICYKLGAVAFMISGSGPTLLTIFNKDVPLDDLKNALNKLENEWMVQDVAVQVDGAVIE